MKESFGDRLKHAWGIVQGVDSKESIFDTETESADEELAHAYNILDKHDRDYGTRGPESFRQMYKPLMSITNERTILNSIMSKMAVDASAIDIKHIRRNDNGQYEETIKSSLNNCLNVEANIDQTGRALIRDIVLSMFDEGVVAVVPVDTTHDPDITRGFDIDSLRTAKILSWMPRHIRVRIYNDRTGQQQDIVLPKSDVAIVENPFYSVMNEQNSTLKRLGQKLAQLDATDDRATSGKLDIIIQLPYAIRTPLRKQQAIDRKKQLEDQLTKSTHGVAYIDSSEKITQLNRPAENQYIAQIELLTKQLYSQLGLTEEVVAGTASEEVMLNYHNRTIEPILDAITEAMEVKFLTKTARTQGQGIGYFRDPFKLVPLSKLAELSDSLSRNAIISPNEMRAVISLTPSKDPGSDQLSNKNIADKNAKPQMQEPKEDNAIDTEKGSTTDV